MRKVYSNYKIFGGFGLLLIMNLLIGFGTYKFIFSNPEIEIFDPTHWAFNKDYKSVLFVLGFQLLFLTLFCTQNRFIIIDNHQITFINPLLPFLRSTRKWSEYDQFKTVEEHARGGTYEAVWLLKNRKIKGRFSSFYYTNYYDLKSELNVRYTGELRINPVKQFFCLLGMKI